MIELAVFSLFNMFHKDTLSLRVAPFQFFMCIALLRVESSDCFYLSCSESEPVNQEQDGQGCVENDKGPESDQASRC